MKFVRSRLDSADTHTHIAHCIGNERVSELCFRCLAYEIEPAVGWWIPNRTYARNFDRNPQCSSVCWCARVCFQLLLLIRVSIRVRKITSDPRDRQAILRALLPFVRVRKSCAKVTNIKFNVCRLSGSFSHVTLHPISVCVCVGKFNKSLL